MNQTKMNCSPIPQFRAVYLQTTAFALASMLPLLGPTEAHLCLCPIPSHPFTTAHCTSYPPNISPCNLSRCVCGCVSVCVSVGCLCSMWCMCIWDMCLSVVHVSLWSIVVCVCEVLHGMCLGMVCVCLYGVSAYSIIPMGLICYVCLCDM